MYSHIIIGSHVFIPKKELRNYWKAKESLTIIRKFSKDKFILYDDEQLMPGYFGVPIYHFSNLNNLAEKVIDNRTHGYAAAYKFNAKLREGQKPLIKLFCHRLSFGKTGFILEASPGFGKTVCILRMLQEIGLTALIVVPKKDLVQQWINRIVEHTDIPEKKIGIASAGKVRYGGCKIVVGLVHTLALDRAGANFRKYFGVVVYDEVDRSMPPATFAPVANLFPCFYRIGASAVMKRQDGLEVIFEKHLEQVRLRGQDRGSRMKPKVLIHRFLGNSGTVWSGSKALNRRGMLLSKLAKNTARNIIISRYAYLIWKSGRRLVIISDRTEQLVLLRGFCNTLHKIPFMNMGFYADKVPIGKKGKKVQISKQELESNAKSKDILFATYGMMALGTDIKNLAGIVYATPQSEIKQSKGRIERICPDKKEPVVVDIVDSLYPDAVRWGSKRIQQYREENLNITIKS